ncbi:MAG: non-canonical purine NTP pyrophosphatase [Candidatus Improbicoccus pseudotrichonymphae]|uniref:Non-canonical purine NTP pyrophosphatase n=1 Tax=Candidatus Improbicoccus pseudotrichonymphae TaxID=3033792 RepID=A0AA48HUL8_9FIRM|nr:MAG: non-canonical purine NTP pyrophosphatase [Candidatus Improbicoccus pseudotrichonymphae]
MSLVFITGNENKAKYFQRFIRVKFERRDIDLKEIQSLDLKEIIKFKVFEAYGIVGLPVIVEDVSLELESLGNLPGTFVKFFLKAIGAGGLCDLLKDKSKNATARCSIGYYNGDIFKTFEGLLNGKISEKPSCENSGFGWDSIFIPEGFDITRAQMNEEDYEYTYLKLRRLDLLEDFLMSEMNMR